METTSKISTISYNNPQFLTDTLNGLIQGGIIEWWIYIQHKAEKDGEKAHMHVIIQPAKKVDTVKLRSMFNELIPGEDKPLGVMPFQKSRDFDNWYWYALHNKAFLKTKGETKKYEYQNKDLICNDETLLQNLIADVQPTKDMVEEYVYLKVLDNPHCNMASIFHQYGLPFNKWKTMRENIEFTLAQEYKTTPRGNGFEVASEDDDDVGENPFIP